MGGTGSSRHVSFDSEDEGGVHFVKGIRLSDRVIERMKESPRVVHPQASTKSSNHPPSSPPEAAQVESLTPGECHRPIMPHPPSYANSLVPPPAPPSAPLPAQPEDLPAPPGHVAVPSTVGSASLSPPQPAGPINPPRVEPLTCLPAPAVPLEPEIPPSQVSVDELVSVQPTTSLPPISTPASTSSISEESVVPPPAFAPTVVLSDNMPSTAHTNSSSTEEPLVPRLPTAKEHVRPPFLNPEGSQSPTSQTQDTLNEDKLQKLWKEEVKTEINIQKQLDEERTKTEVQAHPTTSHQPEDVQKVLEDQKMSHKQTLVHAIRMEQMKNQDEHLIAQYYFMERKAQKLEEKEKDLLNQDALFQEQIAKLQKQAAQFSKVTAESYKNGLEDTHKRFRRHQIKPVCADLQNQILKCYTENKHQTLTCSNIASLYIQCVDAKQSKKLSKGG